MKLWHKLTLIMLITALTACISPTPTPPLTGNIRMFSPQAGQTLIVGSDVAVQSTSVDTVGVQRVELLINNRLVRADENPQPAPNSPFVVSQSWRPRTPGEYLVQVQYHNLNRQLNRSEAIKVNVQALNSQPTATLFPQPPPIIPTETPSTPITQQVDRLPTASPTLPPTPLPPTPIGLRPPLAVTPLPMGEPITDQPPATPAPTMLLGQQPALAEIVVDNKAANFQTEGHWFLGNGGQAYREDCAWAPRGEDNNAFWIPKLPADGTYELFAWWCGDPNRDQSTEARFYINTADGPQQVRVSFRERAGRWNSLGQYRFRANGEAFVNLSGGIQGNVVADAIKFAYISPEPQPTIVPTPLPTPFPWTNNPPSPLAQLAAGDLTTRLLVTGNRFYEYTPIINQLPATFDDCADFPRPGCGGLVSGWRVQVEYLALTSNLVATYKVSEDYQRMALESPSPALRERQRVFLRAGDTTDTVVAVDRYPPPVRTWHLFVKRSTETFDMPLAPADVALLEQMVGQYNTVSLAVPSWGGWLTFYGFGPQLALNNEHAARLDALGQRLVTARR